MALRYGLEGFVYWHYWFNGRRILERPVDEILRSGTPNFSAIWEVLRFFTK